MKIGIDPGNTGAVAFLTDSDVFVDVYDMPLKQYGKKNLTDAQGLTEILSPYQEQGHTAYVERVASMPGQGVASMFNFGMGYGVIQGVLAGLKIDCVLVTPQRWKKNAGLVKCEKDDARILAQRLYPEAEDDLLRKKDIGRADAILIARFGNE